MSYLKFILVGFVFGIVLTKSKAVSRYRIYEMFLFQSFHMYGILIVAICTGIAGIQIIKKFKINDITNKPIFILLGAGFWSVLPIFTSTILGDFLCICVRQKVILKIFEKHSNFYLSC